MGNVEWYLHLKGTAAARKRSKTIVDRNGESVIIRTVYGTLIGDQLWNPEQIRQNWQNLLFMRTWNSLKIIGAVAVATLLATAPACAIVAYNFPGAGDPGGALAGNETVAGPLLLGNMFVVNNQISVTAVGAFVAPNINDGLLGASVPVAIYALSGTTWSQVPNTSFTFSPGTAPTIGSAAFQTISPVTLQPGTYAIVAANYGNGSAGALSWDANYWALGGSVGQHATFQTQSGAISVPAGNYAFINLDGLSTLPTTLPTLIPGNWGNDPTVPAWAGGTFEFDLTPVPEATAFGVAGVGVLGLVYIGRYARLRCKTKLA
jgi:hypothetical protein